MGNNKIEEFESYMYEDSEQTQQLILPPAVFDDLDLHDTDDVIIKWRITDNIAYLEITKDDFKKSPVSWKDAFI